ncbi:MAG: epoxyqueuosine reductase QueH [Desulfobacteraceae bacterium]|nr:epoxyqueuosine reductase QueH [Desulfobacteraceae bacterium]
MELLLHICCGPCLLYPAKDLRADGLDVVGYFYNPNIHPFTEFERRADALEQARSALGLDVLYNEAAYEPVHWLRAVGERTVQAQRCQICYRIRLEAAARKAAELNLPYYSTTLLYSKYQRHDLVRSIGEEIGESTGVKFFYKDFRAGWDEGVSMAIGLGIYRQPYCGCIYSEAERYHKRAVRLKDRFMSCNQTVKGVDKKSEPIS